jgi:hypothetical protein
MHNLQVVLPVDGVLRRDNGDADTLGGVDVAITNQSLLLDMQG